MKATTVINLRRLSVIAILFLLSTAMLSAQIMIKEKVEIKPEASLFGGTIQATSEDTMFTYVMPFNGECRVDVEFFNIISGDAESGDAKLTVNGKIIYKNMAFIDSSTQCVSLGFFTQGDRLVIKLIKENGSAWTVRTCGDGYDGYCFSYRFLIFSDVSLCGASFEESINKMNVQLYIDAYNYTTEKYLSANWNGSEHVFEYVFKQPIQLNAQYMDVCERYYPLPAGTTFTFTIKEGQRYALLRDPVSGKKDTVLEFIAQDYGGAYVDLIITGDAPSNTEYVTVEAKTTAAGINTCSGRIKIISGDLKIIPTKYEIVYGDTLRLDVFEKMADGTLGAVASGASFTYSIIEGNDAGFLYSPDSIQVGDTFNWDFSSVNFAAVEETPQENSTQLSVLVEAYEPGGGGGIPGNVKTKPTMGANTLMLKNKNINLSQTEKATVQKNADGSYIFKSKRNSIQQIKPSVIGIQSTGTGAPLVGIATITIRKEELNHFAIAVIPDTLSVADTVAFTEGAKLVVQAKDCYDEDYNLDASTPLRFSLLTNQDYGTFINANNDTLKATPEGTGPVRLENVLYGDAKAGNIKFAAVKKNPTDPIACKIKVEKQDDPTKNGERDAIVVEQTLKIVMEQPYEVRPSIPTEDIYASRVSQRKKPFEVKMTRNKKPVSNHPFTLWTNYVDGSGGHAHGDTRDIIRENNNDNYGCFIIGTSTERRPLDTLTNTNGVFPTKYSASMFGDTMKIYVKSKKKPKLIDSIKVVEKVDSLINFRSIASNGQWICRQSPIGSLRHPDEYINWCMPEMRDNLKEAIGVFYDWSKKIFGTPIILSLNDMSLKHGGRYDMSGKWDKRTSKKHLFHRTGKSVDINEQINRKYMIKIDTVKVVNNKEEKSWKWTDTVGVKIQEIFKTYSLKPVTEPEIHFELGK